MTESNNPCIVSGTLPSASAIVLDRETRRERVTSGLDMLSCASRVARATFLFFGLLFFGFGTEGSGAIAEAVVTTHRSRIEVLCFY